MGRRLDCIAGLIVDSQEIFSRYEILKTLDNTLTFTWERKDCFTIVRNIVDILKRQEISQRKLLNNHDFAREERAKQSFFNKPVS